MFTKIFSKLILLSILISGPVFAKKEAHRKNQIKTVVAKATATKTTEIKTKTPETKEVETKPTENKVAEIKDVDSKATETELGETKEIEKNASETEAIEEKEIEAIASETFKSGPLTEDDVISMLKEKHKGSVVGIFMDSYPRLIKLTVRATMDENIKKLWGDTLKDKTRYYLLIGFFLLTVLINWFWKRDQIRSDNSIPKRVLGFFYRFFLINIARVGFFIFLFPKEIYPVWVLFRKVFSI
jgi:hypothetical protein